MGDLNTNLLNLDSPRSRRLLEIVESASFHILPLQATHHNTTGQDTWLDIILTSSPSLVPSHGQHPAPGFSHHDLIFLSYVLKPPKIHPKVLHLRSYGRMNIEKLRKDALDIEWDLLLNAESVDDKVRLFNDTIIRLYDVHAPIRKVKIKRPPAPWMTEGVRMAMRRRDKAFRKFRRERCDQNWALFKSARNRCNQMIRNAKRRHILNNITVSSPANIWKFLGTLGIGRQQRTDSRYTVGLEDLNRFFSTTSPFDHQTKCDTLSYLASLPRPNIDPFIFSPVSPEEIKKIILSIKTDAVGCDNIGRRMITSALDQFLPAITDIVNFSLFSHTFPSLWRKGHVIPLPKVPNPSLTNHFRPISILPFLSKVLEACVHKQLSQFVFKNKLLSPLQSGFRPGHSTTTALLKVTGDVRAAMEDTKVTVLALVDFSNAFNNVSHDILLSVLSHLMVSSEALDWFSSYLQGRQQSVRLDESSSSWSDLGAGVPQGGILSPLLFSIFINHVIPNLQSAYHLYADDLQIYSQANIEDVATAIDSINKDLEHIKSWSKRFGLSVNPTKCQAIILGSQRLMTRLNLSDVPSVVFDGTVINWCPTVKDLGLHLDTNLNWRAQVTYVCQKVTGILRALYRLKNFLPSKTKIMLVQTLVFPIVDYGDMCYYDLNADLLNKLDRLLNNCIRFVYNLRKYDHVSAYRSELKWLPIRQRRSFRALSTLYSFLMSPTTPPYLTPYFQYLSSNHDRDLRSANNLLLLCPSTHSDFLHSSFPVQSILLWNSLPLEIRTSTTRHTFKLKVKEYILEKLQNHHN